MANWDSLSMREKADIMKVAIRNGVTKLSDIRNKYNELAGDYSAGAMVDALYENNPAEEFMGEPEHHYDFTQSDEWADAHGYYPDARGHRDDRVKKPAHPSHPSRGTWKGDIFRLTDKGMEDPNYTLFGLVDGGQDPQAVLSYQNGIVLPEWTVTPNGNYVNNSYDNIRLHYGNGGKIHIAPSKKGTFIAAAKKHGKSVQAFASQVLAHPENYSPTMRKKANFARNAAKWHSDGGPLINMANKFEDAGEEDLIYTAKPLMWEPVVTPEKTIKRTYIPADEWQEYWGNEGASSVSNAMHKVAPYVAEGMSMLIGNPLGAFTSIIGSRAGEDLGYNMAGDKGAVVGGLIGGAIDGGINSIGKINKVSKAAKAIEKSISNTDILPEVLTDSRIRKALQDAYDYKHSEGYTNLIKEARKESINRGTGGFSEDMFYKGIFEETPEVKFEDRPVGKLAAYNKETNVISIDPKQIRLNEEVPYHEGLHWQHIGHPEIGTFPKREAWLKASELGSPNAPDLFDAYHDSPEYNDWQEAKNIGRYYDSKINEVVYPNIPEDARMRFPWELTAHTKEAGKALGIADFAPYPGYEKVKDYITKARKYDDYLWDLKAESEEEAKNFWKLLTGNYMPAIAGGAFLLPQMQQK